MTTAYSQPVMWVIGNATAKGKRVHFLNQTGFTHGDCFHPSTQSDAKMATHAAAFIAATLGWKY